MNHRILFTAVVLSVAVLSSAFFSRCYERERTEQTEYSAATSKVLEESAEAESAAVADSAASDRPEAAGRQRRGHGALFRREEAADYRRESAAAASDIAQEMSSSEAGSESREEAAGREKTESRQDAGRRDETESRRETEAHSQTQMQTRPDARTETRNQTQPQSQTQPQQEPQTQQEPHETQTRPQESHVHEWTPVTEQIRVVDEEAWTEEVYEEVPVYETEYRYVCNECGFAGADSYAVNMHIITAHEESGGRGYRQEQVQGRQTGTRQVLSKVIEHPETAHYETVITGYVCRGCGGYRPAD